MDFKLIYDNGSYKEKNTKKLAEIWEPRKEYIEKDLWVIRNFLSKQELDWLNQEANDLKDWYTTMRSPYGGNIKNKFLGYVPEYDSDGNVLVPSDTSKIKNRLYLDFIEKRLKSVLPPVFVGAGDLQSFFEVSDEKIFEELGENVDWAMQWHYERDDSDDEDVQKTIVNKSKTQNKKIISKGFITASFNVYINDNFEGGVLEFKNKDYSIKPEVGMLVNVPLYKEFEHRITKVTNGNRHTLYGRCWNNQEDAYLSTNEDC
jgi:hypothetical protein